ncbi:MAG: DUF3108 domain-containing protein [candidate division WOR-3 bacterium]
MIFLFAFFEPETLVFDAKFGPFKAGKLQMISSGKTIWKGKEVYEFKLLANGGVPFFKINDTIISITDLNLKPLLYKKVQHEGNYHYWGWIAYDHHNGKALYHYGKSLDIPEGSLDPLTLVYVARTLNYDSQKVYKFPYHVDEITETVKVKVVGEERVKTPLGEFDCWIVMPELKSGKNIFGGGGGMKVWISKNERIPVKVEAKMIFGSAVGVLVRRR